MILLTGASGGIGTALMQPLRERDQLIGLYNDTVPEVADTPEIETARVDLSKPEEIQRFVSEWSSKLTHLTIVHAAAASIDGLAVSYSEENWDRVFDVNLKGGFLLIQALLPIMLREKWGRIVLLSSVVGNEGRPGTIAYSASKTGLLGMSRVFAKEYARFNVTSNVLNLGYFETGLIEQLNDNLKKEILKLIPGKSFGKVKDIAHAIQFLMLADYVNGTSINIDGGL
jgi:3-oxoacyl-[acyl-carrier protein] reductase